jgi:hypothetical protein
MPFKTFMMLFVNDFSVFNDGRSNVLHVANGSALGGNAIVLLLSEPPHLSAKKAGISAFI